VVTLRAGGVFFALANVLCVALLVWAYLQVKFEPKTLAVTGSARKAVVSDRVTWSCSVTARDGNLVKAYETINASAAKVKSFLIAAGIPEADITLSAINTGRRFHQEVLPGTGSTGANPQEHVAPTVVTTDKVDMYTLTEAISIDSGDMKRVPEVARSVTSLIKDGVEVDSSAPNFLYTKLSELKIDMVAEATRDATTRAGQIINNANGHLGKLVEARLGVMQVNPKGVTSTSAEGNNDTTSFEKEIIAVVSTRFEVR
jgi:hypothetical protein